jgi:hypothetical protein
MGRRHEERERGVLLCIGGGVYRWLCVYRWFCVRVDKALCSEQHVCGVQRAACACMPDRERRSLYREIFNKRSIIHYLCSCRESKET